MYRGMLSSIKTMLPTHACCWGVGMTWLCKTVTFHLSFMVQLAGLISLKRNHSKQCRISTPHSYFVEWRNIGSCAGVDFSLPTFWKIHSCTWIIALLQLWVLTWLWRLKCTSSILKMFHGYSLPTSLQARSSRAEVSVIGRSTRCNFWTWIILHEDHKMLCSQACPEIW